MLQKFKNGESFAIRSFSEGWVHVAGCMVRGTTVQQYEGTMVRRFNGKQVPSAFRLASSALHRASCVVRRVPCDLKKRASLRDSFSKYLHIPSSKRLIPEGTCKWSFRPFTTSTSRSIRRRVMRLALHLDRNGVIQVYSDNFRFDI